MSGKTMLSLMLLLALSLGAAFFLWQQGMLSLTSPSPKAVEILPDANDQEREEDTSVREDVAPESTIKQEELQSETGVSETGTTGKTPTPEDCENECELYAQSGDQGYCLAYCGIGQEGVRGKNCEELSGVQRDSCYKEQAVKERNPETCAKIGDSALRKNCKARVAEELFD